MHSKFMMVLALSAALAALGIGCGDDDDAGGDAGTDTDADADTDTDADADAGNGANGEFCDLNESCQSYFCQSFQCIPPDPEGVCADGPATGMRILANVRDFYTEEPMVGVSVKITGAISAVMNPSGAEALATATTDADGRFDLTGGTELSSAQVGVVAVVEAADHYLTITGLVEPELEGDVYPPGIRNHDIKAVSQAKLDEWSGYLSSYAELTAMLPLGPAAGGVIGRIRYIEDGAGVPGAIITSEDGTTDALLYYLNEAEDGFNQTATGSSGIFILFNPALAERFVAMKDGAVVSRTTATMGQTAGAIYTNTIHVEGSAE